MGKDKEKSRETIKEDRSGVRIVGDGKTGVKVSKPDKKEK